MHSNVDLVVERAYREYALCPGHDVSDRDRGDKTSVRYS
jgi:hypothetical protein